MMEDLRDILNRSRFSFKKKYGQNFLTDPNLLDAVVRDAGVDETATVLEIGTGAGALTLALGKVARRVVSYEIDVSLRPVLAETLAGLDNAEVVFRDFLRERMEDVERDLGEYVVVANLPYYITTPVVTRFLEESKRCARITVMVQEEVAARFCARENTPEYGAITAAIARRGSCRVVRKVPRTLFTPRPNVDSAIVTIDFREGGFPVRDERAYRETVRAAFSGRRKTLENNLIRCFALSRDAAREILSAAGVAEGARGESLSPSRLGVLSDLLTERGVLPRGER